MAAQENISRLSDDQIQKIRDLENALGVKLVAIETSPFADLDSFQIEELQDLERNMKITLIAYK